MIRSLRQLMRNNRYDVFMEMVDYKLGRTNWLRIENVEEPVSLAQFERIIKTLSNFAIAEIDEAYQKGFKVGFAKRESRFSSILVFLLGIIVGVIVSLILSFWYYE